MKFLSNRIYKASDNQFYLRNGDVSVRDVLKCFDHKHSRKIILDRYPTLKPHDLDACRVWAAFVMEERHEYERNKRRRRSLSGKEYPPVKFMFDENLSWRIVPEVVNNISEVSQIHLEDMAGAQDIEIWDAFKTNGSRAIIITKDDDFVRLSKVFAMHAMMSERSFEGLDDQLKAHPFVVHVCSKKKGVGNEDTLFAKGIIEGFKKHAHTFVKAAMRDDQETVYYGLKASGPKRGDSLPKIFEHYLTAKKDIRDHHGLNDIDVSQLDLKGLNLSACINWGLLNEHRMSVGLAPVYVKDYGEVEMPVEKYVPVFATDTPQSLSPF